MTINTNKFQSYYQVHIYSLDPSLYWEGRVYMQTIAQNFAPDVYHIFTHNPIEKTMNLCCTFYNIHDCFQMSDILGDDSIQNVVIVRRGNDLYVDNGHKEFVLDTFTNLFY